MTKREKELTQQVERLTNMVNALVQELAEAKAEIAELKEQLNKNSQNSSKPPSTDGYKKPAPKSLRKPSGKKQGGQVGHKGSNLKVNIAPTDIEPHMPFACAGCPAYKECLGRACVAETRCVIDAAVDVQVTEHRSMELIATPVFAVSSPRISRHPCSMATTSKQWLLRSAR